MVWTYVVGFPRIPRFQVEFVTPRQLWGSADYGVDGLRIALVGLAHFGVTL
jgi:hypothetical protein